MEYASTPMEQPALHIRIDLRGLLDFDFMITGKTSRSMTSYVSGFLKKFVTFTVRVSISCLYSAGFLFSMSI